MGRKKTDLLDPRVGPLRKRIGRWRQTRPKRSAMPEELWGAAAELAREHGVYATAQALGLSYGSLRTRAESVAATHTPRARTGSAPGVTLVELTPAARVVPAAGAIVEVKGPSGQHLTVRLQAGALDLAELIRACWSGRA